MLFALKTKVLHIQVNQTNNKSATDNHYIAVVFPLLEKKFITAIEMFIKPDQTKRFLGRTRQTRLTDTGVVEIN